jgi:hypothetical protein
MRKLIFLVPILAIVFLACNNQGKVAELQKTIDSLQLTVHGRLLLKKNRQKDG